MYGYHTRRVLYRRSNRNIVRNVFDLMCLEEDEKMIEWIGDHGEWITSQSEEDLKNKSLKKHKYPVNMLNTNMLTRRQAKLKNKILSLSKNVSTSFNPIYRSLFTSVKIFDPQHKHSVFFYTRQTPRYIPTRRWSRNKLKPTKQKALTSLFTCLYESSPIS